MRVKINHQYWNLVYRNLKHDDGTCDAPYKRDKKIVVSVDVRGRGARELEVIIHECLHAPFFVANESIIAQAALEASMRLMEKDYKFSNAITVLEASKNKYRSPTKDDMAEMENVLRSSFYDYLRWADPDTLTVVSHDISGILYRWGLKKKNDERETSITARSRLDLLRQK